jgi:hypothetical protein
MSVCPEAHSDIPTLIVSAVLADLFTAGAKRGDWDHDLDYEIVLRPAGGLKSAIKAHHSDLPGNGGWLADEIGEIHIEVARFGVKLYPEFVQNSRNRIHADLALMLVQNFKEPAHMRAFKVARQINGQSKATDRMLNQVGAVKDADRIADLFDPDPVYRDIALISGALHIRKHDGGCFRYIESHLFVHFY